MAAVGDGAIDERRAGDGDVVAGVRRQEARGDGDRLRRARLAVGSEADQLARRPTGRARGGTADRREQDGGAGGRGGERGRRPAGAGGGGGGRPRRGRGGGGGGGGGRPGR